MKAKEWKQLSRLLQTQAEYMSTFPMACPSNLDIGSLLMALSVIAGQMADREKAKPDTSGTRELILAALQGGGPVGFTWAGPGGGGGPDCNASNE